jgi:hypothetical protein
MATTFAGAAVGTNSWFGVGVGLDVSAAVGSPVGTAEHELRLSETPSKTAATKTRDIFTGYYLRGKKPWNSTLGICED